MDEVFMENYIASQRDHIFRNVEVLIYVFDVESRELEKDMNYYQSCLDAILANSKDAKIFCLIHKMDLVQENLRDDILKEKENELRRRSLPLNVTSFATSIWDETLYKAWSAIVYSLIPNVKNLETHLENFCHVCDADEVVLFERATFLVVAHCAQPQHQHHQQPPQSQQQLAKRNGASATAGGPGELDPHRFEKISNIVKQFKLSCSRNQALFSNMEIRTETFAAFVELLTPNTYIMVVLSDPSIRKPLYVAQNANGIQKTESAATMINIYAARKHFEKIEQGK
ncbi:hypothetical protein HK101_011960 [Irineochytrium annulatum]|nr:hypothetical protein HK101_011960 [Irineochytrium annulatum]